MNSQIIEILGVLIIAFALIAVSSNQPIQSSGLASGTIFFDAAPLTADAYTTFLAHFDSAIIADNAIGIKTATETTTSTLTDGKFLKGLLVDGTDRVSFNGASNINTLEGTIEFWVKPTWAGNDNAAYTLFSAITSTESFHIKKQNSPSNNSLAVFSLRPGVAGLISYPITNWGANGWHHIAFTWKNGTSGTRKLYIDGTLVSSLAMNDAYLTTYNPTSIRVGWGDAGTGVTQANAIIDEIRILKKQRSDAEIKTDASGIVSTDLPPVVAIDYPYSAAQIQATTPSIILGGTAADDKGITQLIWQNSAITDSTGSGNAAYSSTTGRWSTTAIPLISGTNTIVVAATDTGNNGAIDTVNVIYNGTTPTTDTQKPIVSISSPANNAQVSGTITITASATDNVGVAAVEFYGDGILIGSDTISPYSINWSPSNGSHTISAKAFDAKSNIGISQIVAINVSNTAADSVAPSISISNPYNNQTVAGTISINTIVSDNIGVTKVVFFVDEIEKGSDTSSPFSYAWNTSGFSGSHSITAKAYDAAENIGISAAITVTVSPTTADITPPTITITKPANNATVEGNLVELNASASDNVAVTRVEFYLDNSNTTLVGAVLVSNYYLAYWNTTTTSNGAHTLKAKAFDAAGNAGVSQTININVINQASLPSILITSPQNGETVSGTKRITTMDFLDGFSTTKVEFFVDTLLKCTVTGPLVPYYCDWNTATAAKGSHTIKAIRTVSSGLTATHSITVNVDNTIKPTTDTQAPTNVAITSPINGFILNNTIQSKTPAPNEIALPYLTINATASDNVGVTKVEFYNGTEKIGEDTSSPYSYNWNYQTISNETHTLKVKAYDAANNSTTSPIITITINNATTCPAGNSCTTAQSCLGTCAIDNLTCNDVANDSCPSSPTTGELTADQDTLFLAHYNTKADADFAKGNKIPTNKTGTTIVQGKIGNGILVDSTDKLFYNAQNNFKKEEGTIEMWVKPLWKGSDAGNHSFFVIRNTAFPNIFFQFDKHNDIFDKIGIVSWSNTESSIFGFVGAQITNWEINEWHHITITWGPLGRKLYIDGKLKDSDSSKDPVINIIPEKFGIGTNDYLGGTEQANAVIDEFRISSKQRSDEQITNDYVQGGGTFTPVNPNAPTIAITAPVNNANVSETINIQATATAAGSARISKVEFFVDGTSQANMAGKDETPPYSISWNSKTTSNGIHTITAIATDSTSNTAASSAIIITVNNANTPIPLPVVLTELKPDQFTSFLAHYNASANADYALVSKNPSLNSGTAIVDGGKLGKALQVNSNDMLSYPLGVCRNIILPIQLFVNPSMCNYAVKKEQGTIEFWANPSWNGNDFENHEFFLILNNKNEIFRIRKEHTSSSNKLVASIQNQAGLKKAEVSINDWKTNEYHHIAVTWGSNGLKLFIDGIEKASNAFTGSILSEMPLLYPGIWETNRNAFFVGSNGTIDQANALIDDLMISFNQRTAEQIKKDAGIFEQPVVPTTPGSFPETTQIIFPQNRAAVSGTIKISTNQTGNPNISKMEFFVDQIKAGEDASLQHEFLWDTKTVNTALGSLHSIYVKTTYANNTTSISQMIYVAVDNSFACRSGTGCTTNQNCPGICGADNTTCNDAANDNCPENIVGEPLPIPLTQIGVSITSPISEEIVRGTKILRAEIAGSIEGKVVKRVEFFSDNALIGSDSSAPFSFSWVTNRTIDGRHSISARAVFDDDSIEASTPINILLDNTAPNASVTFPAYDYSVNVASNLRITAAAQDNQNGSGLKEVQLFVDNLLKGTDSSAPFEFSWSTPNSTGTHNIKVKAIDIAGNSRDSYIIRINVVGKSLVAT